MRECFSWNTGYLTVRTLTEVVRNLELHLESMAANLRLVRGLISAEAVMMALGDKMGRQNTHEVVHHAAREVTTGSGSTFLELLAADGRVRTQLSSDELSELLDPASHTGLSAALARETSGRARETVQRHREQAESGS